MHFALAVWTAAMAWYWGDWRNWRLYHPAMMYFALGNLLYNFLCANHLLWKLHPDFLPNHSITEMVYTFVTFPATSLLFLSRYPKGRLRIVVHYIVWVGIYSGIEWMFAVSDRIIYQYGWSWGWSLLFDCIMFPMLRLFHTRPLLAYFVSAAMCVFWVWLFDIPVNVPIDQRK